MRRRMPPATLRPVPNLRKMRDTDGHPWFPRPAAVLLPIGFTWTEAVAGPPVGSYPTFSSLQLSLLFFSVALSLKSPSADVIRYRRPLELGLSSGKAFRLLPATAHGAGEKTVRLMRTVFYSSSSKRWFGLKDFFCSGLILPCLINFSLLFPLK